MLVLLVAISTEVSLCLEGGVGVRGRCGGKGGVSHFKSHAVMYTISRDFLLLTGDFHSVGK